MHAISVVGHTANVVKRKIPVSDLSCRVTTSIILAATILYDVSAEDDGDDATSYQASEAPLEGLKLNERPLLSFEDVQTHSERRLLSWYGSGTKYHGVHTTLQRVVKYMSTACEWPNTACLRCCAYVVSPEIFIMRHRKRNRCTLRKQKLCFIMSAWFYAQPTRTQSSVATSRYVS